MYKVSVPLVRFTEQRDDILRELEKLGAQRVFLCPGRGLGTAEEKEAELLRLADGISFFEGKGYEVGVWISSIGHGGALMNPEDDIDEGRFTQIVGLEGKVCKDSFCPRDPNFLSTMCAWVDGIARAGAKMIMLDDDFRMSDRGATGCLCPRCLAELERRLGEPFSPTDAADKIFRSGPGKYRDAWLGLTGDAMRDFARALRKTVDAVSPKIRLGACSCISVWDSDGVDSIELARIFAGETKPFMRLIGAAYWSKGGVGLSVFNKRLQYVLELERMQSFWCRNEDIEIFAEGDVYPRPRFFVPSAYLEGMDTVMRAEGSLDGILKYAIDYSSSPLYETGYTRRAERNKPLYREIDASFSCKKAVGINVACEMKKVRDAVYPDGNHKLNFYTSFSFFQPEQAFLAASSLPMTYGERGVTAVFGENARRFPENRLGDGLILDAASARLLTQRGVDVGIEAFSDSVPEGLWGERFPADGETTFIADPTGIVRLTLKKGAKVLSEFIAKENIPACFSYEDALGRRFVVYAFDASIGRSNERLFRNYCRQRQLISAVKELSDSALPAVCPGNPDLYLLAKRGDSSLAVGLWNFFEDSVIEPVIYLDKKYSRVHFIACSGRLEGDRVYLESDIPAFGFAGIETFE